MNEDSDFIKEVSNLPIEERPGVLYNRVTDYLIEKDLRLLNAATNNEETLEALRREDPDNLYRFLDIYSPPLVYLQDLVEEGVPIMKSLIKRVVNKTNPYLDKKRFITILAKVWNSGDELCKLYPEVFK